MIVWAVYDVADTPPTFVAAYPTEDEARHVADCLGAVGGDPVVRRVLLSAAPQGDGIVLDELEPGPGGRW